MKKNTRNKPTMKFKKYTEIPQTQRCTPFKRPESTKELWTPPSWKRYLQSPSSRLWTITLTVSLFWPRIGLICEKWFLEAQMVRSSCGAFLKERPCFRSMLINNLSEVLHLQITVQSRPTPYSSQREMTEKCICGRQISWRSNLRSLDQVRARYLDKRKHWAQLETTNLEPRIWASTSWQRWTIATQRTCSLPEVRWYSFGTTKDQRLCKRSSGELIRSPKSNSIQVKSICWQALLWTEAYACTILEEIPQLIRSISRISHRPFAGILRSPWTWWSEMKILIAIHLISESQSRPRWYTRITSVPSLTSISLLQVESLLPQASTKRSESSHPPTVALEKSITPNVCSK